MLGFNTSNYARIVNNLTQLGSQLAVSNERLVTGMRINRASDDPAGIVTLTSLNSHIARIDGIASAGQRVNDIINTADGALEEISSLITTIETNVNAAVGADPDDIITYQANVDMALDGIDRLVNTTKYNGKGLLNGNQGYSVSIPESDKITDVKIYSANTSSSTQTVNVDIINAESGQVSSDSFSWLPGDLTLSLTGPDGSANIDLLSGSNREIVRDTINAQTGTTGIVASIDSGKIVLNTQNPGADKTVSVAVTAGVGNMTWEGGQNSASDSGVDFTVSLNGDAVNVDSNTNKATFNLNGLSGELTFTESFYGGGSGSTTFSVSGNGAGWSLGADAGGELQFGIPSVTSSMLGNSVMGYINSLRTGEDNDLSGADLSSAQEIVSLAGSQVSNLRARMGALQNYTINSTLNAMADTKTALQESIANVAEIDYTQETANNNRLQLLMEMGTSLLASMNTNSNNILSLLSTSWIQ